MYKTFSIFFCFIHNHLIEVFFSKTAFGNTNAYIASHACTYALIQLKSIPTHLQPPFSAIRIS